MTILDDVNDRIPDWVRWTYIGIVFSVMGVATLWFIWMSL